MNDALEAARRRERARIRAEYARRARELPAARYHLSDPGHRFLQRSQERAMAAALSGHGAELSDRQRLLEIGCGGGRWLRFFANRGAPVSQLIGLDLDLGRLHAAPGGSPRLAADASCLPFASGCFDRVLQSTVMSSILDAAVRQAVAAEMLRVLRPGGALLWYDLRLDNPRNKQVKGIRRRTLRSLFPGCTIAVRRTTLAPPLARLLARRARPLATLLDASRLLASHELAVIRPR